MDPELLVELELCERFKREMDRSVDPEFLVVLFLIYARHETAGPNVTYIRQTCNFLKPSRERFYSDEEALACYKLFVESLLGPVLNPRSFLIKAPDFQSPERELKLIADRFSEMQTLGLFGNISISSPGPSTS